MAAQFIRSQRATREMGGSPDTPRRPGPWHRETPGRHTACGIRIVRLGLAADRLTAEEPPTGDARCRRCEE